MPRIGCTGIMKRTGLLLAVTLLFAAGCGSDAPPTNSAATPTKTTPSTSGSASPSTTPTTSAGSLIEFTVDGAGPYLLGKTLTELQATPGLADVKTGGETCPENTTATGTGVWADVRLSFRKDGKLYLAVNRSPGIPTPSGAWLGTTLADLKKIYAGVTTQELKQGTHVGFLVVTITGRAILFDLDEGQRVMAMISGDSSFLRTSFTGGTDFC